jgi:hypothetical protein
MPSSHRAAALAALAAAATLFPVSADLTNPNAGYYLDGFGQWSQNDLIAISADLKPLLTSPFWAEPYDIARVDLATNVGTGDTDSFAGYFYGSYYNTGVILRVRLNTTCFRKTYATCDNAGREMELWAGPPTGGTRQSSATNVAATDASVGFGAYLRIAADTSGHLYILDLSNGAALYRVDASTRLLTAITITGAPAGVVPRDVAVSDDGASLYFVGRVPSAGTWRPSLDPQNVAVHNETVYVWRAPSAGGAATLLATGDFICWSEAVAEGAGQAHENIQILFARRPNVGPQLYITDAFSGYVRGLDIAAITASGAIPSQAVWTSVTGDGMGMRTCIGCGAWAFVRPCNIFGASSSVTIETGNNASDVNFCTNSVWTYVWSSNVHRISLDYAPKTDVLMINYKSSSNSIYGGYTFRPGGIVYHTGFMSGGSLSPVAAFDWDGLGIIRTAIESNNYFLRHLRQAPFTPPGVTTVASADGSGFGLYRVCPAGWVAAGNAVGWGGVERCEPCPIGSSAPAGSSDCVACSGPNTTFAWGSPQCSPCYDGTYPFTNGIVSYGYYKSVLSTICRPCEGTSTSYYGGTAGVGGACSTCPAGYFAAGSGGQTSCTPCPLNTYRSSSQWNCTACSNGGTTASVATTSSSSCIAPTLNCAANE